MPEVSFHEDLGRKQEGRGSSDRSFGIVFAIFFALAALWPLRTHHPVRLRALALSIVFFLLALLFPRSLNPLNRVWTRLGLLLGRIVSPVVTGLLFYTVVTPIAVLFRLMKKDPLRLTAAAASDSYWLERRPPGPRPETMINQF